jgi:hypothetical protein
MNIIQSVIPYFVANFKLHLRRLSLYSAEYDFKLPRVNTYNWLPWSRCSVMAIKDKVRGFKPGRSRRIFEGEKFTNTPSFGREVKLCIPCRTFTASKRYLIATWKSDIIRLNLPAISRPHSSNLLAASVSSSWKNI